MGQPLPDILRILIFFFKGRFYLLYLLLQTERLRLSLGRFGCHLLILFLKLLMCIFKLACFRGESFHLFAKMGDIIFQSVNIALDFESVRLLH